MMGNTVLDAQIEAEAKGLAEGEAKGKAEGEAKGMAAGKAELLLTQLRLKFKDLPAGTESRVRSASAAQLDAWAAAILTATTLDELLATKPAKR